MPRAKSCQQTLSAAPEAWARMKVRARYWPWVSTGTTGHSLPLTAQPISVAQTPASRRRRASSQAREAVNTDPTSPKASTVPLAQPASGDAEGR
jgi:hypothetical protein